MGEFTFVPVWVIQDILVIVAAVITVGYILKSEEHPGSILLEFVCFCLLYAAVYENFATLMGWYGYGRSVIMVFNVPITIPIIEYMVVYSALRLAKAMGLPVWVKPFYVGLTGMLFDFSLDPVAMKQIFDTKEGLIGRWTWYPGPTDVAIFGEPVYNFSGWVLLCGYAAAFLLLGRWWHQRSKFNPWVGYSYPVLAMLASLLVLVSPLSRLLLWLEPFLQKGSQGEWIMLAVHFMVPTVLLLVFWRGKMLNRLSPIKELPILLTLVGFPLLNIFFTLAGGFWDILWLVVLFAILQSGLTLFIFYQGRGVKEHLEAYR